MIALHKIHRKYIHFKKRIVDKKNGWCCFKKIIHIGVIEFRNHENWRWRLQEIKNMTEKVE